ncbi:uncharacterized protein LOC114260985 [Camellia sinensis]|uniref:uncharacterized protein LOC114260985 n=1 Tax=Camellia sinensis TaxID=4442 RepID=UPI0010364D90|nr:uncharacterized protein LOC114260985 [Camellia sinensis]
MKNVLVRDGGGRDVLKTFKSKEERQAKLENIKVWVEDWCKEIVEWEPELVIVKEQLGRKEKMNKIKSMMKARGADIALFQETKKASMSEKEVRELWGRERMDFMTMDVEGTAVNLYAPNAVGQRGKLWESLLKLKEEFPNPWCLGIDFNEIRNIGERKRCSRRDKGIKELNEFIDKSEVNDLPQLGRRYTWCNSREWEKWSRIDRVLVEPKWLESFNQKLWGLPRALSDHSPLLLIEDERDWIPRPFRFLNAWTLHPNFLPFVEKLWKEHDVEGWARFRLFKKMTEFKLFLKQWNSEVFGNVNTKLKQAKDELHKIDLVVEERELEEAEKTRRREVSDEICRLYRMVGWMWLQKSRLNWGLKEDKNSRYFHVVVNCR